MVDFFKEKWVAVLLLSVVVTLGSLLWTGDTAYHQADLSTIELGWPVLFVAQNHSQLSPPDWWFPHRIGLGLPQEYPTSVYLLRFSLSIFLNFLIILSVVFIILKFNPRRVFLKKIISSKYVIFSVTAALSVLVFLSIVFERTTRLPMGDGVPLPQTSLPQPTKSGADLNIFLGSQGVLNDSEISGPHLSLPTLPFGWYVHRTSDSSYFITKQKDLPDVGAAESSAYGDSVSVSLAATTHSPEAWVTEQEWLADEALIRSKVWVDMHGHQALQVQRETEAALALTDFLFIGNLVYTITLYPYPGSQALGVFNDLLDKYASDPAYKIVSDAQARTNCETLVFPYPELEKDIMTDTVTGIVTVGYLGENNEKKTMLLNYKNDHSYAGCSVAAHKILSTIKTQSDKYDADMRK